MTHKVESLARPAVVHPQAPHIIYPVLDEPTLSSRWNLSPKTLQRWRMEGIGPPAWHLARQIRYLLIEIETFERKAQVTAPGLVAADRIQSLVNPNISVGFGVRGVGAFSRISLLRSGYGQSGVT